MPSMQEIYQKHAVSYDELINAEDYQQNLDEFLLKNIKWKNKIVYEAGIGTGRITRIFADQAAKVFGFDREKHMLEKCNKNLTEYKEIINLKQGQNTCLPLISEKADIFIEGWSFAHTIVDAGENFKLAFDAMYNGITRNLKPEGTIILIESLGTNVDKPYIHNPNLKKFYKYIEEKYSFKIEIVATDYKFESSFEAARIAGFFFGKEMSDEIKRKDIKIVPEFTGIWSKQINGE